MAEPTLPEVFGANATQTATTITIDKANLGIVGFNPAASNSAESIFVALVLMAQRVLTEENRAGDAINRGVTVFYSGQDLINQGSQNYRRDAYSVLLYKQQSLSPVVPGDY